MSTTYELFFIFGAFLPDGSTNAGVGFTLDMTLHGYFIDPLTTLYSLKDGTETVVE